MPTRHVYPFEKLRVWQSARDLIKGVYRNTKAYPRNEVYGLISHTNRAAVSVAANLAEGSSRTSRKDQAHFSQIASRTLFQRISICPTFSQNICSILNFPNHN